jgi:glutamate 5-kinase
VEKGRSLLSVGVEAADGEFEKGDVVSLIGPDGREFARGLSNYPVADVQKIRKLRTAQLAEVLGREPYEEVIHRDNMVVVS